MRMLARLLDKAGFDVFLLGVWLLLFCWPFSLMSDMEARPASAFAFLFAAWAALILIQFLQSRRGRPR